MTTMTPERDETAPAAPPMPDSISLDVAIVRDVGLHAALYHAYLLEALQGAEPDADGWYTMPIEYVVRDATYLSRKGQAACRDQLYIARLVEFRREPGIGGRMKLRFMR